MDANQFCPQCIVNIRSDNLSDIERSNSSDLSSYFDYSIISEEILN